MATYDAHIGDSGTALQKTLRVGGVALGDLSGATFIVRVTKPSGVVESWDTTAPSYGAAGFWGMAAGALRFVTPDATYWDEQGPWIWDVQYTLGGVTQTADPITLSVGPNGAGASVSVYTARRYVVIGDSISSDPFVTDLAVVPWVRLLATRMRNATAPTFVYTRGVPSRAFTDWTEARLYEAVRAYDATDAIVYLGTNDLLNAGAMGLVFLMARANTVFDYLASLGLRVHAINIAPVGLAAGDPDEVTRQAYNPWLLGGGATAPETMIDVDILLRDGTNPNLLAAAYDHGDGVHPSNAGHVLIGDAVGDALGLP